MKKKYISYEKTKVYAIYYSKNDTLYYNTSFDQSQPKIIKIVVKK